jgi:dihydrofolate reductase
MGLLTFSINVTLDGCVDHKEGIADDETHAFFTRLMDESGAMLWGRVTYEMMESYWPAVARGDEEAPRAIHEWAVKLEAKPKYVVSSTRKTFPWTNSHHIGGGLRTGVQRLKDAISAGVLLGSGKLATELDRLDLIDEYKLLVHPRIAGHGPTLYQSGLPSTRRLELISAKPLRSGAVAMHYRRALSQNSLFAPSSRAWGRRKPIRRATRHTRCFCHGNSVHQAEVLWAMVASHPSTTSRRLRLVSASEQTAGLAGRPAWALC